MISKDLICHPQRKTWLWSNTSSPKRLHWSFYICKTVWRLKYSAAWPCSGKRERYRWINDGLDIFQHFFFLFLFCFFLSPPSPIPEFSNTPQENHIADDKVRASSSSSSLFTLNLPNGLRERNWEGCGRKKVRNPQEPVLEENPGNLRQGRELKNERGEVRGRKTQEENGQRQLRRDRAVGWLPIFTCVVFESTPREDLQCVGLYVHSHSHLNKHVHSLSCETLTQTQMGTATHTVPPCTWTGLVGKASPPPHAPIDPPAATACFGTVAWTSPVYCEGFPENTRCS